MVFLVLIPNRLSLIMNAIKKPKEQISLQLLYSNCVPILSYATEVKQFSYSHMYDCHVVLIVLFDVYIVTTNGRVSHYDDLYSIFNRRRLKFESKLPNMENQYIALLFEFPTILLMDCNVCMFRMFKCHY